jgi:hypothetical protein
MNKSERLGFRFYFFDDAAKIDSEEVNRWILQAKERMDTHLGKQCTYHTSGDTLIFMCRNIGGDYDVWVTTVREHGFQIRD